MKGIDIYSNEGKYLSLKMDLFFYISMYHCPLFAF